MRLRLGAVVGCETHGMKTLCDVMTSERRILASETENLCSVKEVTWHLKQRISIL